MVETEIAGRRIKSLHDYLHLGVQIEKSESRWKIKTDDVASPKSELSGSRDY